MANSYVYTIDCLSDASLEVGGTMPNVSITSTLIGLDPAVPKDEQGPSDPGKPTAHNILKSQLGGSSSAIATKNLQIRPLVNGDGNATVRIRVRQGGASLTGFVIDDTGHKRQMPQNADGWTAVAVDVPSGQQVPVDLTFVCK